MSHWDSETAEWYAQKYGDYPTNRLGIEAIQFPSSATVVDIGCGTGSALRAAAKQITTGQLIGVDPVPRMVEIAREQTDSERIVFYEGSAERLPVGDFSAEFVLAFDSFDHWQDQAQGLKEVRRILKPNGQFVVVKDGGLPHGSDAKQAFVDTVTNAGFTIIAENEINKNDIVFTIWFCTLDDSDRVFQLFAN